MSERATERVCPRVYYYWQPMSMGLTLAAAGGIMSFMMLLAYKPEEHWLLCLSTIAMGAGFFAMFCLGVGMILTIFQKVTISAQGITLKLFGMVLRRIPAKNIRSVTGRTREIILRSKDVNLHRMTVNCNGTGPNSRGLWIDWDADTEAAFREQLPELNYMF